MRTKTLSACMLAAAVWLLPSLGVPEDGFPVAGTEPAKRPLGAAVIQSVQKDASWYARALTGISQPYPDSLRFLEDQGNWYTPFDRPGMTGRYDLRGWHE